MKSKEKEMKVIQLSEEEYKDKKNTVIWGATIAASYIISMMYLFSSFMVQAGNWGDYFIQSLIFVGGCLAFGIICSFFVKTYRLEEKK